MDARRAGEAPAHAPDGLEQLGRRLVGDLAHQLALPLPLVVDQVRPTCATPIVPVGRSTRRISASAPLGVGDRRERERAQDRVEGLVLEVERRAVHRPPRAPSRAPPRPPPRACARPSPRRGRSPTASPVGPTRRAAGSSAPPAPQPTSSTRPPGPEQHQLREPLAERRVVRERRAVVGRRGALVSARQVRVHVHDANPSRAGSARGARRSSPPSGRPAPGRRSRARSRRSSRPSARG